MWVLEAFREAIGRKLRGFKAIRRGDWKQILTFNRSATQTVECPISKTEIRLSWILKPIWNFVLEKNLLIQINNNSLISFSIMQKNNNGNIFFFYHCWFIKICCSLNDFLIYCQHLEDFYDIFKERYQDISNIDTHSRMILVNETIYKTDTKKRITN